MRTLLASLCSLSVTWISLVPVGVALPPPDDLPEEVLRTQIILEGRSPITGAPLTAAERASLETSLTANVNANIELSSQVREAIWLLSIRKGIRLLFPFLRLPISGGQPGNQSGNQSGNQPGNQPGSQSSGDGLAR